MRHPHHEYLRQKELHHKVFEPWQECLWRKCSYETSRKNVRVGISASLKFILPRWGALNFKLQKRDFIGSEEYGEVTILALAFWSVACKNVSKACEVNVRVVDKELEIKDSIRQIGQKTSKVVDAWWIARARSRIQWAQILLSVSLNENSCQRELTNTASKEKKQFNVESKKFRVEMYHSKVVSWIMASSITARKMQA